METPEQYHGNEASHGNYQFSTLKEIVDGMMMSKLESDSYIKNTNRNLIIYHAKMGIKELTKVISGATLAIEMTVGKDSCIVLPQDFVSCESVSVVVEIEGTRKLCPLDRNQNINTATGVLQDNDAKILFDDNGFILTADASNAYNMPYKSYEFIGSYTGGNAFIDGANFSVNGEYKVDEENGKLVLDSRLIEREVVLVYKSDGLQWESFAEGEIKVHKYLEQALKDWIYYACIEQRQTVPANEKRRALDRYKTTRFEAKKKRSGLNLQQIAREMRSKSKFL